MRVPEDRRLIYAVGAQVSTNLCCGITTGGELWAPMMAHDTALRGSSATARARAARSGDVKNG